MYYVYRYMIDDKWIYVGKSKVSVRSRIDSHKKEEKFKQYLKTAKISFCEFEYASDMDAAEMALIKIYKPLLNEFGNNTSYFPFLVDSSSLKWIPYQSKRAYEKRYKALKNKENLIDWYRWIADAEENEQKGLFCSFVADKIIEGLRLNNAIINISYPHSHIYKYAKSDWINEFIQCRFGLSVFGTIPNVEFSIPEDKYKDILFECAGWVTIKDTLCRNAINLAETILNRANIREDEALQLYQIIQKNNCKKAA